MPLRHITKVSEMAQQEKGPAAKHKDQSLIRDSHSGDFYKFSSNFSTQPLMTYAYFKTNTTEVSHLKSVPKFTSLYIKPNPKACL